MKNKRKFTGIIPPIVTPLIDDEALDKAGVGRLIHHCIKNGVSGVFVNGTSGEALRLSEKVWEENTKEVLLQAGEKIHVFCGAIDTSTTRTIEKIKKIEAMGGKIAVCTPPFYLTSFGQDEILRHFDKIAANVDIDIALYNIPETTHATILPETAAKLADYDSIVAFKDSTADWQQLQRTLIALENKDIAVFNGAEELCSVSMLYGACGCIPGLANFLPELFVKLYDACMRKDTDKSYMLQKQINEVRKCIFINGCWMSGMKALLELFNLGTPLVSAPLLELTKEEKKEMQQILEANNIHILQ